MKNSIDIQRVREVLHYEPETGFFTWKINRIKALVGRRNYELMGTGRVQIRVLNQKYQAHRLAWAYVHGEFPDKYIDHINGDPADNRLVNLRLCTHAENHQNKTKQSNNTSGYLGVNWHKLKQRWRATIAVNQKHIHLGLFDTAEDAYKAYCEAKARYHTFSPVPR